VLAAERHRSAGDRTDLASGASNALRRLHSTPRSSSTPVRYAHIVPVKAGMPDEGDAAMVIDSGQVGRRADSLSTAVLGAIGGSIVGALVGVVPGSVAHRAHA
jgi:hypothetical protein